MARTTKTTPLPHGDEVLARALLRAAGILGLKKLDVATMIGTSASSVSRMARGRPLSPETKEGELALIFLRLFRSLDALVGGNGEQARAWLHAHNHHLAGIPAHRILGVQGLVDTVRYLDALRGSN